MKNLKVKLIAFGLIACFGLVGCYGPFRLTKDLHEWNGTIGDKWVNALVFFGLNIIPVYGVAVTVDAIVLNTIEFWTGDNPVSMKKGESSEKIVKNENGTYKIVATKNHFEITAIEGAEKGESVRLKIDSKDRSLWLEKNAKYIKIAEMNNDLSAVTIYNPDGTISSENSMNYYPLAIAK